MTQNSVDSLRDLAPSTVEETESFEGDDWQMTFYYSATVCVFTTET